MWRRVVLQGVRADDGEVGRGGEEIIGERAGEELALEVIGEVFEQRATEPLHDGADGLAVQGQRIDDAADIFDGHVIDQRDMAGAGIDRDMGGVGAVGISAVLRRVGAVGGDVVGGERGKRNAGAVWTDRIVAVDNDGGRLALQALPAAARMASLRKPAACTMAEPPITMERDEYEP